MAQLDMTDTSFDLLQHVPSGDIYATISASEWDDAGEHCIGSRIIKIAGPLHHSDLEAVRQAQDFDGDDTDLNWANEQEWVKA